MKSIEIYDNNKLISKEQWNEDGSPDYKEFYDDNGKIRKKTRFDTEWILAVLCRVWLN